ncbi:TadE/TadG family type IV pilus assembly protein [Mesorhizobium sp. A556]
MPMSTDFLRDQRGNFALITAFLAVPLLMTVGMSVDYSTILRTRSNLQNTLDAAVLAVAREGKDVSDARAREIAELFVAQNFAGEVSDLKVTHVGTSFSVDGRTKADIAFGHLLGYDGWTVAAASSADIAYSTYEVGLVLDTTGSMAGGKLTAMKDAVTGLIDDMSSQVQDKDKLKFALVPFSSFVNVGPGLGPSFDTDGKQVQSTGAAWLDLKGANPISQSELSVGASRFQLYKNLARKWSGCVETREAGGQGYDVSDAAADPNKPESLFVPAFAIDEPDSWGYLNSYISSPAKVRDNSVAQKRARWAKYGVTSNVTTGAPRLDGWLPALGGGHPTPIQINTRHMSGYGETGPGFGCVSQPIVPLSNDYAMLKSRVNSFAAEGNTNIMEGVAWGMRVLSPGEPFAQGLDPKKGHVEKILIVLTDGSNTFTTSSTDLNSTYSSFGYLADGRIDAGGSYSINKSMNDKTQAACTNAKAQGMEVYTIRLEEPDVATGTMLLECASKPENYFDVPSRSQLDTAFEKIKDRIATVRISS